MGGAARAAIAAAVALALTASGAARAAEPVPLVRAQGTDLRAGGRPFVSYGFNYTGNNPDGMWILRYFDRPTERRLRTVRRHFSYARRMGANTLRIFLELPQFMRSPADPDERALRALDRVLAAAERKHLYLDLTGNLDWRPWTRAPWYDALGERARWAVQARFWRAVASRARAFDSVLVYELSSEPAVPVGPTDSWYTGPLGRYEFGQFIVRDLAGRDPRALALAWTRELASAVRSRDPRHLVSVGLTPFSGIGFDPDAVAGPLDVLIAHEYPNQGQLERSTALIRRFAAQGKPLILGETAPLACDAATQRAFLLQSKPYLDGVLGFFDGRRPADVVADSDADRWYRDQLTRFLRLRAELTAPY